MDIVLANNRPPEQEIAEHYLKTEGKEPVPLVREDLDGLDVELIEDSLLTVENGTIRHNALKTAFQIFAFLMRQES